MSLSSESRRVAPAHILADGVLLAGIAVLLLLVAFPPAPGARRFAVDAPDATLLFDSFWDAEGSGVEALRWSDGRSALLLNAYREHGALVISAPLTAPQYPDAPGVPLTLRMDGRDLARLEVPPRWRTYHILLMPVGNSWRQTELFLIGTAESSGTADERRLGAAIRAVRVLPLGDRLWLPALLRCVTVALVALLAYQWLRQRSRPLAVAAALALGALPVVGWHAAPGVMALLQPSFWDLGLLAAGGFGAYYYLARGDAGRGFGWVFGPLALLLALSIIFSLGWRIGFDSAIMLYLGWLIDRFGAVPYRDFFEQNMPGVYLFNAAVGRVFGYSDLGFRLADQALLALTLGGMALTLRPLGRRVAVAAMVTFGLFYLGAGMYMGLQREFVILPPIVLALAVARPAAAHGDPRSFYGRLALAGVCFGAAATIKPHALIGLPIVAFFFALARVPAGDKLTARVALPALAVAGCGACASVAAVLGYLWVTGALPGFLELATTYWPIYGRLDGLHRTTDDINYPLYLLRGWFAFGGHHLWLIPAAAGVTLALRDQRLTADERTLIWSLVASGAAYSLYPIPAGKFWSYHWLPLVFFLIMLAALCFRPGDRGDRLARALPLIGGAVIIALARPAPEVADQLLGRPISSAKLERTDMVAAFLRERLRPGDRVQTLDWTGGAIHGALIAEALPATSFVEDFYFYHHVSNPTIQRLRARFLAEFDQARPRFVVQVVADDKPWVNGPDTTTEFSELDRRLAVEYQPLLADKGVVIYERRAP